MRIVDVINRCNDNVLKCDMVSVVFVIILQILNCIIVYVWIEVDFSCY